MVVSEWGGERKKWWENYEECWGFDIEWNSCEEIYENLQNHN